MKKFNKAYGEAKVSVREKIGKRDSLTELPDYKIKTKSIDEIRNSLKELTTRLVRQSKAHQVLINDNTSLADCFTESGTQLLQEEIHTSSSAAILGPTLTILGDMHNQFEMTRSKLDIGINDTLNSKWQDYLKNDLKDAAVAKARYDKFRVSFDASTEAYKNLRKKNNIPPEKLTESEQDLQVSTQQFSDVAVESLYIFEDIIDKITVESIDTVYDYIKVYETYFSKGLEIVREILPNIERQRQTCAKIRQSATEKKKKRQEISAYQSPSTFANSAQQPSALASPELSVNGSSANQTQPNNNINNNNKMFGISLESLQSRDGDIIPAIIVKAIQFLNGHLGVEGLFRVSPNQKHLNEAKLAINNGNMTNFDNVDDPHLVCALIKSFFRELPTPLLTYELFRPLVTPVVESINEDTPDHAKIISQLAATLSKLPQCNRTLFQLLLKMLSNITSNSKENKMTSSNLAVVLAPNILYPLQLDMESITEANATVEYMIRHFATLYPNSDSLESLVATATATATTVTSSSTPASPSSSSTPSPSSSPSPTPKTFNRLNRQSVILPQTPQQSSSPQDWRRSVGGIAPPALPAKPSLVKLNSLSSSTSQLPLPQHTNNNSSPPMSPPALPPKRLSSSTSQLLPSSNPALNHQQQTNNNYNSNSTTAESNNSDSKTTFNNRRSMFIGATPVLPALPTKPPPKQPLNATSSATTSTSNTMLFDAPPPLATLPSQTPPTLPPKNSSSSSFRKRPQAIKIPSGTTVLTSPDGTTAKYSLLDDSFYFENSNNNMKQPLTKEEDIDLIEW